MAELAKSSLRRKIAAALLVFAWLAGLQLWISHSQRAPEPRIPFPKTAGEIPP